MAAGITGPEGFKQIDSLKKELRGKVAVKYRLFVTNMLYDLAVNTPSMVRVIQPLHGKR